MNSPSPVPHLELKPDFVEARARWEAFWNHEIIDRPCCVIRAPLNDGQQLPLWPPYMAGARENLHAVAEQVLEAASAIWYGGEAIPCYTPSFGPDMFAAWLGAELEFPEENFGTSWAVPCIDDWETALPLKLREDNYWWQRMLEFCRVLAEVFRGKMLVAHLDLHSNMDALLALRGGDKLCIDLIETPELIDRAMADVRALYRPIYNALFHARGMDGVGTLGWVAAYHPARTNTIQCDFAALIGPRQFRRWALPALEEEASFLGHCVYHLDGPECLVHLNDLCAIPGLDCIQWVHGARNKPFIEWMDLLKEIQAHGVAVWIPCTPEEIPAYHKELKPNLLFYECWAPSRKAGERTLEWLRRNT